MAGFSREEYLESLQHLASADDMIPCLVHDLRSRVSLIFVAVRLLNDDLEAAISDEHKQEILASLQQSADDILNIANAALAYHEKTKADHE